MKLVVEPRHSITPTSTRPLWAVAAVAAAISAVASAMLEKRIMGSPPPMERELTPSRKAPQRLRKRLLFQVSAEPLDAAAGLFQVFGLGGVRDAERRSETERRALHHCNAFRLP